MTIALTVEQILEQVRALLGEVLSLPPDRITPEARVMDDLHAESIDLLDLRFRLERQFGFRVTQDDLTRAYGTGIGVDEFRRRFTVAALVDYVRARLASAP